MKGDFAKTMNFDIITGILIPFVGTSLGAGCVFFMRGEMNATVRKVLTGFAAGVMSAASVWSLIIPAVEQSAKMGKLAFIPAVVGFLLGIFFLLAIDNAVGTLHTDEEKFLKSGNSTKNIYMMIFAVVLHNIPEGMAVGVAFAGYMSGNGAITLAAAFALALGIGIQNFPEGAIVSMPLVSIGEKKSRAFLNGVLSGAVEPVGAVITVLAARLVVPVLPYLLSFAAGAMMYVVTEELIPEMHGGKPANIGTVMFALGFVIMMSLDVALG